MKGLKKPLRKIAILSLLMVYFVAILAVTLWLYTATQLRIARIEGVYSSPEDGMRVLVTGVGLISIESKSYTQAQILLMEAARTSGL